MFTHDNTCIPGNRISRDENQIFHSDTIRLKRTPLWVVHFQPISVEASLLSAHVSETFKPAYLTTVSRRRTKTTSSESTNIRRRHLIIVDIINLCTLLPCLYLYMYLSIFITNYIRVFNQCFYVICLYPCCQVSLPKPAYASQRMPTRNHQEETNSL